MNEQVLSAIGSAAKFWYCERMNTRYSRNKTGKASGGNVLKVGCIVTKRAHFLHSKNPLWTGPLDPPESGISNAEFPNK